MRILLILTLSISLLKAAEYAWPIQAAQSLSATFCEYRDGHLHAGIDIKTWGEMEVPCVAIGDGYIEKISVRYYGYGKALFLRLNDGRQAVYAHLERFPDDIERKIRALQQEQQRYKVRLEFSPNEYPIKRRQVLAFSGTSGTQHPHLHFEIYDAMENALNPLRFYPGVVDDRAPTITELLYLPMDAESRINGSLSPVGSKFSHGDTTYVSGRVLLALNDHDRANGTLNRYAPYSVHANLDGIDLFEYQFDAASIPETENIAAVYLPWRSFDTWRYLKLYHPPGQPVPPFMNAELPGIIEADPGFHSIEIQAADFRQNQSEAIQIFHSSPPDSWELLPNHRGVRVSRIHASDDYRQFGFSSGDGTEVTPRITYYTSSETIWDLEGITLDEGLRVDAGRVLIPPRQTIPNIGAEWRQNQHGWYILLKADAQVTYPLHYRMYTPAGIHRGTLWVTSDSTAETEVLSLRHRGQAEWIELIFPEESPRIDLETMDLVSSSKPYTFSSPDRRIHVKIHKDGAALTFVDCDTALLSTPEGNRIGLKYASYGESGAEITTTVRFRVPDLMSAPAVFKMSSRGRWRLMESDLHGAVVNFKPQRNGTYVLLEDLEAPEINIVERKASYRPGNRLVFKIADILGYIGQPDTALVAMLDGDRFFPDWNSLRNELTFRLPSNIGRGEHLLYLEAADRVGNRRSIQYTLKVR